MNKVKFTWRKRNKPRHTGARTHNAQDINKDKELPFCIVFCPKTDFYHKQHTYPPHTTYDANWGLLTQLQSTGSQRARHDRVTNTHTHTHTHTHTQLYEKEAAPHSSTLAWRTPRMEEPGRLPSMGQQRVRHGWATNTHPPLSWRGGPTEVNKNKLCQLAHPTWGKTHHSLVKLHGLGVGKVATPSTLYLWMVWCWRVI